MKFSQLSLCLLPALALAQTVSEAPQPAQAVAATYSRPTQTTLETRTRPAPTNLVSSDDNFEVWVVDEENMPQKQRLELRQAAVAAAAPAAAAATAAQQVSPVTIVYLPTNLPDGGNTWMAFTYTQTFASVPDQWSSAAPGSIGMGTIQGSTGVTKTAG